ncbi:MAG: hypothetical protein KGO02_01230 [Alphaproteobacteria bacterium]|nr:hypothetical protein [Alphaproteobacteria bacterium]
MVHNSPLIEEPRRAEDTNGGSCSLVCGGGLLFSADALGGLPIPEIGGTGAAAKYSFGRGYFSNGPMSKFQSYGAMAAFGSHGVGSSQQGQPGTAWGLGAGVGAGFFLANAMNMDQLSGPFDTKTFSMPGIASVQWATSGSTWYFSMTFGPAAEIGYSHYTTTTDPVGARGNLPFVPFARLFSGATL